MYSDDTFEPPSTQGPTSRRGSLDDWNSVYSDDTFEPPSTQGGPPSRRESMDDEYDNDDFLQESQREFEESVVENYDDDFESEADGGKDAEERKSEVEGEDNSATPINDEERRSTSDVGSSSGRRSERILRGTVPSPVPSPPSAVDHSSNLPNLPAVTDPYILHLLREAERKRADDAASGSFPAQEEQVAARVFDVPFSSSVPMMVRHLLFFIISYYYLRWSDTELKSHLFFSSLLFFFLLAHLYFVFVFVLTLLRLCGRTGHQS